MRVALDGKSASWYSNYKNPEINFSNCVKPRNFSYSFVIAVLRAYMIPNTFVAEVEL